MWCIVGIMPRSAHVAHRAPTTQTLFSEDAPLFKMTTRRTISFLKGSGEIYRLCYMDESGASHLRRKKGREKIVYVHFLQFQTQLLSSWYYTRCFASTTHTHANFNSQWSVVSLSLSASFSLDPHTPPPLFQSPLLWEPKNNIDDE